ncbi:MAG: hypothetical protein ACLP7F_17710, partial [Acidimicrobiales bacterium]
MSELSGPRRYGSAPSRARPRRRLLSRALGHGLVVALVTAGWAATSPPAGASNEAAHQATGPVWICRPGQAANPCATSLAVTAVTSAGKFSPATWPSSAVASKFECFYVHPT